MPNDTNYLDIALLGKEYRVACPAEEREALLAAVAYVDAKMHDIAEKTRSNISERIAVMAALNIAHEFLSLSAPSQEIGDNDSGLETGLDFGAVKRRITLMEAQLDSVLEPQDKLI
jgi:cell division protein ZapA